MSTYIVVEVKSPDALVSLIRLEKTGQVKLEQVSKILPELSAGWLKTNDENVCTLLEKTLEEVPTTDISNTIFKDRTFQSINTLSSQKSKYRKPTKEVRNICGPESFNSSGYISIQNIEYIILTYAKIKSLLKLNMIHLDATLQSVLQIDSTSVCVSDLASIIHRNCFVD
jgi:hypothetical protein